MITTVGYGDINGATSKEYVFAIVVEFCGLSFFSLYMGVLGPIVRADESFKGLIVNKYSDLDMWILKIEKSLESKYIHCGLYETILSTIELAMMSDFNMIIEEYNFYNQLTPRLKNDVIHALFTDFIEEFEKFFSYCGVGFRNEFIINMLGRKYEPKMILLTPRSQVNYIYFITRGFVSFYDADETGPHLQMTTGSWFGDSNVFFGLKSNYMIKTDIENSSLLHFFSGGFKVKKKETIEEPKKKKRCTPCRIKPSKTPLKRRFKRWVKNLFKKAERDETFE